jgi:excisionase family DNA binding protein
MFQEKRDVVSLLVNTDYMNYINLVSCLREALKPEFAEALCEKIAEKKLSEINDPQSMEDSLDNMTKQQPAGNEMMNMDEASKFLDCSKGYLYKLTMKNMIPHYKPTGKRIYFYRAELDDWIKQGKVKTTEEISQEALKYCVNNPATAKKRHNTRNEK